jgi:hypothetical protein
MAGMAVESESEQAMGMDDAKERRDRLRPMKVWVSAAERQEIEARAASSCLSISAYLRAAALSHPIRRIYDLGAIEQLAVVGRDLSRLCQLMRAMAGGGGGARRPPDQRPVSSWRRPG